MRELNIDKNTLHEMHFYDGEKMQRHFYDGNKYQPPFDPELDAMDGVTDDEMTRRFKMAVRMAILAKKVKRVPVACYDEETGQAYLEYPDGHREYANF